MNFVHDSFLDELTDDYICASKITVENKFCLAKTLVASMERVLEYIRAHPNGPSPNDDPSMNRLVWLVVTRGDLHDRLDREAYMMDGEQYRQVFEYLEQMLGIEFTSEERTSPIVFENAWRFFKSINTNYRTFVHPDNAHLQPELDELWAKYDAVVADVQRMDMSAWSVLFEDCYFERGLATAKNDIRNIQKCMEPYGRKTYSFVRGEERFQKLFKFHGQRPELLEQYALFKDLMVEYIPLYILETKRKLEAADKKGYVINHRDRMEETLKNANKYIQQARVMYVRTDNQLQVFDTLCKSIGLN